jgi:histidyl-tRNA synthetase
VLATLKLPNAVFDPNIVRGFDYYTGLVFEVFDTNGENQRSLFGGGRYDNLLEIFGVEPVPCVGFGMGDITIRDFLETHKLPLGIVPVSGRA